MSSKFFTNQDSNTLFNKFTGVFTHNKDINNFDVLVGYFRSSGYFKLRPLLENVANIRILVGIDVDKITEQMQSEGLALFKGDGPKTIADWGEKFIQDITKSQYDEQTEQGIKQFVNDMTSGKVQLKAHPSKIIHAKIYIFRPDNYNEHNAGSVITGSSNLTNAGLGTKPAANYEFNALLNDYEDIKFATDEFEKLWIEGIEILPEVAQTNLKRTHLDDTITPYELYIKLLIEYFGEEIEFDPNSIKDLPNNFKRLEYQMDAVNQGYQMLKKHNGFFLSDVVGLGKTVIATMIARQFIFLNEHSYNPTILLIIPPTLMKNWVDTLLNFKIRGMFDILPNGSLHKITAGDRQKYDMVIVDEAHKFRNDTAGGYTMLQQICKTPTTKNKPKKVILISATPINNRPEDLYNQILLFQDGNNSTLDFTPAGFFNPKIRKYKEIMKFDDKTSAREKTAEMYEEIREKVIEPLMIRRTRTDLLNNKDYKKDLDEQGIIFPKTTPPKPIYYQLETQLEKLYHDTIQKIDNKDKDQSGLLYSRYQALHYLKPEFKQQYTRADFIAERLAGIMRILLLKRMDSSFYAFQQTINRFIKSSEIMLKMIENNKIIIAPNININEYILDDKEEELMELLSSEMLTNSNIIICTSTDFEIGFIAGVRHDLTILKQMQADWMEITADPKINEFLEQLPELLHKEKNPEQKIVIFTESKDTMDYISKQIQETEYKDKILAISSENRNQLKTVIEQNFDANSKGEKKDDYQIIITTDVLAEGINLHRANTVINYDTPWNATKLMQRIGRVNRIGQMANHIFVYNFYPTEQINTDIGLEKRALVKLQAFHSALGEDSQIYSLEEDVDTYSLYDQNAKEEKSERIPLLYEIRQFRRDNPEDYKRIKDMPNKVRNAVKNPDHKNSTMVFARTDDQISSRFYLLDGDNIEHYSFVKTAKLLKCRPDTRAAPLHNKHYGQVKTALQEFSSEMERSIIEQTQGRTLSMQDNKAIKWLKSISNLSNTNNNEKQKMAQAIEYIQQKRFQQLVKDINKLSKNSKGIKPIISLENTIKIIEQYQTTQTESSKPKSTHKSTKPSIIISQSYV